MSNPVELSVKSQLHKIVADLEKISGQAKALNQEFSKMGDEVEQNIQKNKKKVTTYLEDMRALGGRVAGQLKSDFRSLFAMNALKDSMALSNQFKGTIKEAFALNDTIRKFGATFGIAGRDFVAFQTKMIRGLGEIGISSEAASSVMQGLSGTKVRGQNSLLDYSRTSGMLASATNNKGREGDIAKGIAEVIRARGGDVNDAKAMQAVAEDLNKAFISTGKSPIDLLESMQQIFSGMAQDFRKTISSHGLAQLAVAGQAAGPNSVKFIEEFLSKSPIARRAFEAQGGKGVFSDKGVDFEKFAKVSKQILGRVGGDPRLAAQTMGLSEEAGEGFVRLAESLQASKKASDDFNSSTADLAKSYQNNMGFAEGFRANIERIKRAAAGPLSYLSQKGSGLLSSASRGDLSSSLVVGGGAIAAAALAGFGLRGVGKGLGGAASSIVRGGLAEQITGKETIPVYVVNASEMGGGEGTGSGIMKGLKGAAKWGSAALAGMGTTALEAVAAGGVAGGAAITATGAAAGYGMNEMMKSSTSQDPLLKGADGQGIDVLHDLVTALNKLASGGMGDSLFKNREGMPQQKIKIELKAGDLKGSKPLPQGKHY